MPESAWGWLIIAYLFLAGAGAGAFLTAVARKILAPDWSAILGRAGSLVSGPLVAIGTGCLVLDLEAGFWEPWRQFYLVSNPTSMITWGVVILSAFIPIALLHAEALNKFTAVGRRLEKYLLPLEIVGSVFAVATAAYTGVLIAVINGVPFWNTSMMPVLFLASAVSTGMATAMIGAAVIELKAIKSLSNFALRHLIFLGIEALVLMLFIFMSLSRPIDVAASAQMLIIGILSPYFWLLVVILGMAVPFVLNLVEYFEYGEVPKSAVLVTDFCVLIGGMTLRALIIFADRPPQIIL